MAKTILIADDDSTIQRLFQLDLESRDVDIRIRGVTSGEEAIRELAGQKPDVVVLDLRMPRGDGFSVLDHMKKENLDIPVVILTNYSNDDYQKKSKTFSNVREYIVKHETRMEKVLSLINQYLG